ncbi:hypothetical protein [Gracilibacillus sp. JCM 18860]|uniref:hypothetical protein n=1 Tax=Gracilibacillus sp. JCM 18860 TaxID=1306159 RepID=UPI0006D0EBB1
MEQTFEKNMSHFFTGVFLVLIPLFILDRQHHLELLYTLVGFYTFVQIVRDYIWKLSLEDTKGILFLCFQLLIVSIIISVDQSFISQVYLLVLIGGGCFSPSIKGKYSVCCHWIYHFCRRKMDSVWVSILSGNKLYYT